MTKETRTCASCSVHFDIAPEDFAFYASMNVPSPTWCPECRLERRLSFWNLFALYRRKCDLCGKTGLSMYPHDAKAVVYCPPCWYSDNWDPLSYGRDYDFSRPFFEQAKEMWRSVPLLGLSMGPDDYATSPHNNQSGFIKNCYLMFDSIEDESCSYGTTVLRSKEVVDCTLVETSETCYDSMHLYKCNGVVGSRGQVSSSLNSSFLKDSKNCQSCFASSNLRGKNYCIFNTQYTKEQYEEKMKEWDLGSHAIYTKAKQSAAGHWRTQPIKPMLDDFSENCSGSNVIESKNCHMCFEAALAVDSKYLFDVGKVTDSYDISNFGGNLSRSYEGGVIGLDASRLLFCQESGLSMSDSEYSKLSFGAHHHFGCVSVRKTPYCIFNKQYSPEKYEVIVAKIRKQMMEMPYRDGAGREYRYGEFFPAEMSPHPYNDTVANDMFPKTREQCAKKKLWFREPEKSENVPTITAAKLPDHIKDVTESILREVIECEQCRRGFRVIPTELAFLRQMNLPLPRACPFCRIKGRHAEWMKELRTMTRVCSTCGDFFATHYDESENQRPLCKKCYIAEVV